MWGNGGKIRETLKSEGREELQMERVIEAEGHGLRKRVKNQEKQGFFTPAKAVIIITVQIRDRYQRHKSLACIGRTGPLLRVINQNITKKPQTPHLEEKEANS